MLPDSIFIPVLMALDILGAGFQDIQDFEFPFAASSFGHWSLVRIVATLLCS